MICRVGFGATDLRIITIFRRMNYMNLSSLRDSLITDWTNPPSSDGNSVYSSDNAILHDYRGTEAIRVYSPVVIHFNEESYTDHQNAKLTVSDSSFDTPSFLRKLIEDIAFLETEIRQKTQEAMKQNLEQTLIVLTMHNLVMKIKMEATVKELESVANKSYKHEDSPVKVIRNNLIDTDGTEDVVIVDVNEKYPRDTNVNISDSPERLMRENNHKSAKIPEQSSSTEEDSIILWLENLVAKTDNHKLSHRSKEAIGSKQRIEKVLEAMKKFRGNEKIEDFGIQIFKNIAALSNTSHINLIESGCLEYLKDIFVEYWPRRNSREATITYAFWVFIKISQNISAVKYLLKDSYLEMFLLPFSSPNFSKYNIITGYLLTNLLRLTSHWYVKLAREEVDDALYNNMENWQLGKFCPITFPSAEWAMRTIKTGTKSQKRFCAWRMANTLTIYPEDYSEVLRKQDAIPIMNGILADPSTHYEIRRLLRISLDILKK